MSSPPSGPLTDILLIPTHVDEIPTLSRPAALSALPSSHHFSKLHTDIIQRVAATLQDCICRLDPKPLEYHPLPLSPL